MALQYQVVMIGAGNCSISCILKPVFHLCSMQLDGALSNLELCLTGFLLWLGIVSPQI